jgi:hypothetical protein
MTRPRLAKGSSKIGKQTAGRRALDEIPVTMRSAVTLGSGFKRRIQNQLASRLEHAAGLIERVTVRFVDVNGPRGGVDTVCRIKVVMSGRPSIVVEKRSHAHDLAFARAVAAVGTAATRTRRKHDLHATPRRRRTANREEPGQAKQRVRPHS